MTRPEDGFEAGAGAPSDTSVDDPSAAREGVGGPVSTAGDEHPPEVEEAPQGASRNHFYEDPVDDVEQRDQSLEDALDQPDEPAQTATPEDELVVTQIALAERTTDLQRLQAEFLNYKRRVDRDRELIRENATYSALAPITEVLDTIDRARDHEPLDGGFKAVAEQLERVVAGLGVVRFGAVGDPFDPTVHEALSHIGEDPDVTVTTCKVIAKSGYRIGGRVVRAAQVLVVDPAPSAPAE